MPDSVAKLAAESLTCAVTTPDELAANALASAALRGLGAGCGAMGVIGVVISGITGLAGLPASSSSESLVWSAGSGPEFGCVKADCAWALETASFKKASVKTSFSESNEPFDSRVSLISCVTSSCRTTAVFDNASNEDALLTLRLVLDIKAAAASISLSSSSASKFCSDLRITVFKNWVSSRSMAVSSNSANADARPFMALIVC